ncbi:fimbrial adapter papK [Escherichia coli P0299438.10]|nr:fimbrial adapter papK [Escherichia coli P0299438.10]ENB94067.1 fimbrial adapter papK [Escherichia coli P0299438.4]
MSYSKPARPGISGIRLDVRRQSRLSSGWKTAMQRQLVKLLP